MSHAKVDNTLSKIKQAFIILVERDGFHSINVSDIAKQANINRGTFYLHYLDKFDLLDKLELTVLQDVRNILIEEFAKPRDPASREILPYNGFLQLARYFQGEKALIRTLLNEKSSSTLLQKIKQLHIDVLTQALKDIPVEISFIPDIPRCYVMELVTGVVISVMQCWIVEDRPENPKELSDIIDKIRYLAPMDMIRIK